MKPVYEKEGIKIYRDEDPPNPRIEWDNVGTMVCFHKRYTLGDRHDYCYQDYDGWDELREAIVDDHGPFTILPLYMYDHGGLTISTTPFTSSFDSGQVGFIYCSEARALEEGVADIEACLQAEVEEYDQYLRGEVYGYEKSTSPGESYSCWGFYGYTPEELWQNVKEGKV